MSAHGLNNFITTDLKKLQTGVVSGFLCGYKTAQDLF